MNPDSPWYYEMAGRVPLPNFSEEKMLFVGSLSAAESERFVNEVGITHILTVAKGLPVNVPIALDRKICHKSIACDDHPLANILETLVESIQFISEGLDSAPKGRVLVHCASGVSRSVTVCAAFLMLKCNMKSSCALKTLQQKSRKYANPNLGFRRQLDILESHEGNISEAVAAWSEHCSNVVEDTHKQREAVNNIHAKVDVIEEKIAKLKSMQSTKSTDFVEIKNDLVKLQTDLDSCLPARDSFIDPPAKMIRKAANTKIDRLYADVSSLIE